MIKRFIHLAKIEKEIMLGVGLRMIDSHEVEEVDALLDSGVTVYSSTVLGCTKRKSLPINWSTLLKFIILMEALIEEEVSWRK